MSADYGEVPKGSVVIFFRKVKFYNEEAEEALPNLCTYLLLPPPPTLIHTTNFVQLW
jgi:hypothetical protein